MQKLFGPVRCRKAVCPILQDSITFVARGRKRKQAGRMLHIMFYRVAGDNL